jgi:hypothetical protein
VDVCAGRFAFAGRGKASESDQGAKDDPFAGGCYRYAGTICNAGALTQTD